MCGFVVLCRDVSICRHACGAISLQCVYIYGIEKLWNFTYNKSKIYKSVKVYEIRLRPRSTSSRIHQSFFRQVFICWGSGDILKLILFARLQMCAAPTGQQQHSLSCTILSQSPVCFPYPCHSNLSFTSYSPQLKSHVV